MVCAFQSMNIKCLVAMTPSRVFPVIVMGIYNLEAARLLHCGVPMRCVSLLTHEVNVMRHFIDTLRNCYMSALVGLQTQYVLRAISICHL